MPTINIMKIFDKITTVFSRWLSQPQLNYLSFVVTSNILDHGTPSYDNELEIKLSNGLIVKYAIIDNALGYIRMTTPRNRELAYWIADEIEEDPLSHLSNILEVCQAHSIANVGEIADHAIDCLLNDLRKNRNAYN